MESNTMDCDTPTALRFLASSANQSEAVWMRKAADEIERLKKDNMPDGFVKWLTITRGPTGRLHAHWPYADSKGCLVTRELMDQMLRDAAAKPRWIPVSERLPDDRQQVIACFPSPLEFVTHAVYEKDPGWFSIPHYGAAQATHWMPLPEPPKCATQPR